MDQPPITDRAPGETAASDSRATRLVSGNLVLLSQMLKKPRLVQLWLTTARRAQVAFGICVLAVTFGGPPTTDWLAQKLYPTQYEEQRFFQRLTGNRTALPNPLRAERRDQFLSAAWVLGIGTVLLLLLGHVPRAVAIGRQRAAVLLARADRIEPADPNHSARLRLTAQGLVINDDSPTDTVVAHPAEVGDAEATIVAPDGRAGAASAGGVNNGGTAVNDPMSATRSFDSSSAAASASKAQAPEYVGADRRYRLEKQMGGGGMGVVHAATDMLLERSVALKQLYAQFVGDHEHSMRFRQEAMALASLTHPHIVTMYDLIEFDFHFWIVMELLSGGSLADRIQVEGSLTVEESIDIACDIASALDYAHRRGVVHRDVKPMNILFTSEGVPKLADFGTAKLRESWIHTTEGEMLGSPAFMSPEQVTGAAVDARTDVYCLGISLYQMLTGKVPFDGDLSSILAQHVNRQPDPPRKHDARLPPGIDSVVLKMLEKEPDNRYQSCAEVVNALRAVLQSRPSATG